VLGLIEVPVRAVEAIIAASVLIAAIMNLFPQTVRFGWRLAFGFGLVHGLGFANALRDLGVDAAGVFASLGGFNVGVELGQLAFIAVVFGLSRAGARLSRSIRLPRPQWRWRIPPYAIGAVAAFWTIERVAAF
jgi:hypothetical protein